MGIVAPRVGRGSSGHQIPWLATGQAIGSPSERGSAAPATMPVQVALREGIAVDPFVNDEGYLGGAFNLQGEQRAWALR